MTIIVWLVYSSSMSCFNHRYVCREQCEEMLLSEIVSYGVFVPNRMKDKKSKSRAEAARELEQGIHLIKAPSAMQSEPGLTLPKLAQKTKVKVSTSSNVEMQE